jgi:hypothetical protein
MRKLPVLAAAAGAAALFAAGDAYAQLPLTNCQDCVPRNNGDPGSMCWSGGGDLGACWEREAYDADGNVLYTYCMGSPCGTAE